MQRDSLVTGLTAAFGAMAAFAVLAAVALLEPVLFVVAAPLAAAAVLFWYHASGRLYARVRRRQAGTARTGRNHQRGGFGAGPRGGFESARGRRARANGNRRRRRRRSGEGSATAASATSMRPAEAYRVLEVEAGADEDAVKRAYREKVKTVHPDRGGDEEAFKRVTDAYETLTESD